MCLLKVSIVDIWFNSIRLHLLSFYFFERRSTTKLTQLTKLYYIACNFVENVTTRDRLDDYAFYLSEPYYRTLSLAATALVGVNSHAPAPAPW